MYRRGMVPEHVKAPVLMVLVLVVYWASNLVQHEAGLLSETLMGLVVGNMRLVEREALQRFKENLTVVLLSVLFIIIPSQLVVDGVYHRLKDARMAGVETYYGEILSEHAEHTLESQHLNYLLCATDNDFYNALVCGAEGRRFGHHRSFQLATHQASGQELRQLTLQKRGYFAFEPAASLERLEQLLAEGWTVQTTKLTARHDWSEFKARMDEASPDWLPLGGVSPSGMLRLYSREQRFKLEPGWTALSFAPVAAPAAATPEAGAAEAADKR